jgi:hypothetical protein
MILRPVARRGVRRLPGWCNAGGSSALGASTDTSLGFDHMGFFSAGLELGRGGEAERSL